MGEPRVCYSFVLQAICVLFVYCSWVTCATYHHDQTHGHAALKQLLMALHDQELL